METINYQSLFQKGVKKVLKSEKKNFKDIFSDSKKPTQNLILFTTIYTFSIHNVISYIKQLVPEFTIIHCPGFSYIIINFIDQANSKIIFDKTQQPFNCITIDSVIYNVQFLLLNLNDLFIYKSLNPPSSNQCLKIIPDVCDKDNQLNIMKWLRAQPWKNTQDGKILEHALKKSGSAENNLFEIFFNHLKFDNILIYEIKPGNGIVPKEVSHMYDEIIGVIPFNSSISISVGGKEIYLKINELTILQDEFRYGSLFGVNPRRVDNFNNEIIGRKKTYLMVLKLMRTTPCICKLNCDFKQGFSSKALNNEANIEKKYVYEVYEEIAQHFDQTRYNPWPKVKSFLDSIPKGSNVCDIGCGNGKYLGSPHLNMVGCDMCRNLIQIGKKKDFEVIEANCLHLPFIDNAFDASISIAVIHHLSTEVLRLAAIKEMLRITENTILIYVWAIEREGKMSNEQDVLIPWHLQKKGTKTGNEKVLQRYYHLFKKGELEELILSISGIKIIDSYYDHENWCVVCSKQNILK